MIMDFTAALDAAQTLARVDDLARELWHVHGRGLIADADAELVAAQIEEARRRIRPKDTVAARAPGVPRMASNFPPRRRCASPDKTASLARRRRVASSGPMPPALSAGFTEGQRATLAIVVAEVRATGECALSLGGDCREGGRVRHFGARRDPLGRWRRLARQFRASSARPAKPDEHSTDYFEGMAGVDHAGGGGTEGWTQPITDIKPRRKT